MTPFPLRHALCAAALALPLTLWPSPVHAVDAACAGALAGGETEIALDLGDGTAQNAVVTLDRMACYRGGAYRIPQLPVTVMPVVGADPELTPEPLVPAAPPAPASVAELIHRAAKTYGLDEARFLRVARCESGLDPAATNPRSKAAGVMQFLPRTWAWASPRAGYGGHSPYEAEANVMTAGWLARNVGWNQWECR